MKKVKHTIKLEDLPEQAQRIVDLEARLTVIRSQRIEAVQRASRHYDEQEAQLEAELKFLLPPAEECIRKNSPELFPGEERSTVLGSVRVGMRYTPHSVAKTGREKWEKWDEIARRMHQEGSLYVRLTPEVDRQAMLANRTSDDAHARLLLGQTMTKYGLKFAQDENIYIEGV